MFTYFTFLCTILIHNDFFTSTARTPLFSTQSFHLIFISISTVFMTMPVCGKQRKERCLGICGGLLFSFLHFIVEIFEAVIEFWVVPKFPRVLSYRILSESDSSIVNANTIYKKYTLCITAQ